jgi:hypothetical protein
MRRRNYQHTWAWLTAANIADFYRVIESHRRKRQDWTAAPAKREKIRHMEERCNG